MDSRSFIRTLTAALLGVSIVIAIAMVFFVYPQTVRAQPPAGTTYSDPATSEWFKSLTVPGSGGGCCDQADCHRTPAKFVHGVWLALSKYGNDEWVVIPFYRVEPEPSIFKDAVLCENNHMNGDDEPSMTVHSDGTELPRAAWVWVYCFSQPPEFS